jgi:hypothetical protein
VPGAEPAERAGGVPWIPQALLVALFAVGLVLCAPFGGVFAQIRAAGEAVDEASLERGEQIADVLGSRNAEALAADRGIALETGFVLEREGVRGACLTDARGTVLAPPEKLRTSIANHPAYRASVASHETERADIGDGVWEIAVPVRAEVGGSGPRQIVGYAVVEYDPSVLSDALVGPWVRVAAGLLVGLTSLLTLVAGAWWLVLRPLATLREETELALRGDADRVVSPTRLAPMEQLAHSINRVLARARARG